ncbi:unnamed protein product [Caenorhabditis bovis]|uniref:Uncharacterized protein n=1 Tax=Caenorhabditis bovis TaxID=2654633 RepID=A0A8S1F3Z0_9PELO|nr:unnamed protein product [Caenorhabditis bovis]
MNHQHHDSPDIVATTPNISWLSFLLVYSIPMILFISIVCIVKWRPIREFSSITTFISWYCSCSPRKLAAELDEADRDRFIYPIDAQSLVTISSCDSPLLNDQETQFFSSAIP